MRHEEQFSGECLTDGDWKNIFFTRRADWEQARCQKCMSALSQCSAQVQGHSIVSVPQQSGSRRQKQSLFVTVAKNRHNFEDQSLDTEWHVCPGDTANCTPHLARITRANFLASGSSAQTAFSLCSQKLSSSRAHVMFRTLLGPLPSIFCTQHSYIFLSALP